MLKSETSSQKEQLRESLFGLTEIISKERSNTNEYLVSNAAIIAIMQECPCITRCSRDIMKQSYSNEMGGQGYDKIDSLYAAKHNLAKNSILEAIQ
jgi:hypothetical protein